MARKKSQNQLLVVESVEEAEKQVYKMIQQNKNFREITKVGFSINDIVKRFNPSQISQIKAKFEPKVPQNNRDSDKALAFKLFKEGVSPTDVVIDTGFSYEFVNKSYMEYLSFEKREVIPEWFYLRIYELAAEMGECNNDHDVCNQFKDAIDAYFELQNHIYYCCRCGKEIPIRGKSLQAACDYLSKNWGHTKCINSN